MKKYSDSELAANLIQIRNGKYPLWKYFLKYLVIYLCFLVPASLVFWLVKVHVLFFVLLFGLFTGALGRDFGWLRHVKHTWPFQQKVLDWQKVEQLADTNADTK